MVWQLGWVDLDLGSSPGWWAATVATYCPSRMVEHSKSKSTQPSCQTTSPTLYVCVQLSYFSAVAAIPSTSPVALTLSIAFPSRSTHFSRFLLAQRNYSAVCLTTGWARVKVVQIPTFHTFQKLLSPSAFYEATQWGHHGGSFRKE